MTQLSRNLAALLALRGMTATSLARETKVSQPTIHRILKGESEDPRTETLKSLADFFGVGPEVLREGTIEENIDSSVATLVRENKAITVENPSIKSVGDAFLPLFNSMIRRGAQSSSEGLEVSPQSKRRALQDLFVGGLEDAGLPGKTGQAIKIFGHRYRFGYCSENVVAEFCILWLRKDPETLRLRTSTLGVIRSLWHLSLCAKDDDALPISRRHVLFLLVADENDNGVVGVDPWADSLVQKLRDEGRVHGVELVRVMSPADGVAILRGIEEGTEPDYADDDDFFDV